MTIVTQGVLPPDAEDALREIARQCNEQENAKEDKAIKNKKKKRSCQKLGQDKHKCCEEKIKNSGRSDIEGEKGYNRPKFDQQTGQPIQPVDKTVLSEDRATTISNAIAAAGPGASRKAISQKIGQALAGKVFPDAAIVGPPKVMVDFKFACPESHRSKKKKTKKNYRPPRQSANQTAAHNALGDAETITILN